MTITSITDPELLYVNALQVRAWLEISDQPRDISISLQQLLTKASQFERSIPGVRRRLRQISETISLSPPQLTINGFGPVRVRRNGKLLTLQDWQTRDTRDLFLFFIQSGTHTKEEVAAALWPEISPARLKMRFGNSIYRLRRAVGQESVVFDGERYQFNRHGDYEYDVEAFDELLRQAGQAKDNLDAAGLLKAAVALVKGPYLADVDADWAVGERSRLESACQTASLRLARLYIELGRAQEALEVCRAVLQEDGLLEEAHRLEMRAYAALGDRAGVARQFRLCSEIFESELGVKPSKETESLYKQLTQ